MARSGGATPIRDVRTIASSRTTKTFRRRWRARARRRSSGPRNRTPLRGVTIQRPVVPCTSAFAKSSILCSKSITDRASERFLPRGTKKATHMMPNAPRSIHSTSQPPGRLASVVTQHLGWDGTVAPHLVLGKHIDVIPPPRFRASFGRRSPGGVVLAGPPTGFREEPDAFDPGGAIERFRRVVERERGDRDRGERFHLHPGAIEGSNGRDDVDPALGDVGLDGHVGARDPDRVTVGQQIRRLLDADHPRDLRGLDRRTLLRPGDKGPDRLGRGHEPCLGGRLASGLGFFADLDDPRRAIRSSPIVHRQSSDERNSRTRTRSPGPARSTPGAISARPFARATVAIRLEPRPPVGAAVQPSGPLVTSTRASTLLSFGPLISPVRVAVTSGRPSWALPIILRIAGRTNISKLTKTLTGFPGRPKNGLPSMNPNPCGIPGCIATR